MSTLSDTASTRRSLDRAVAQKKRLDRRAWRRLPDCRADRAGKLVWATVVSFLVVGVMMIISGASEVINAFQT
jgi:hypothetical protein